MRPNLRCHARMSLLDTFADEFENTFTKKAGIMKAELQDHIYDVTKVIDTLRKERETLQASIISKKTPHILSDTYGLEEEIRDFNTEDIYHQTLQQDGISPTLKQFIHRELKTHCIEDEDNRTIEKFMK